ncbi:MAG: exo-alpha-sialidase [Acidimicrobiia bacterium]|nr:exo-alpha-sialidase [Acidimicrobiia bacterium]
MVWSCQENNHISSQLFDDLTQDLHTCACLVVDLRLTRRKNRIFFARSRVPYILHEAKSVTSGRSWRGSQMMFEIKARLSVVAFAFCFSLPGLAIEKFTVSRDDALYEAFADIAQAPGQTLVITYRESLMHAPYPFSRVVVRRSLDGGNTWLPKQTLLEKDATQNEGRLNCSRIAALSDGSLLLVVDFFPHGASELTGMDAIRILLFRSRDSGKTWEGPLETGVRGAIVPSLKQLSNGDLLMGLTRLVAPDGTLANRREEQLVYRSRDVGRTWEGPAVVPQSAGIELNLNEGDFAEMDDGTVVIYMREDKEGFTGWKSFSRDGGRTWSTAYRARMFSVCGRPSVGRLRSGEVLVTYRTCAGVSASLALYAETPAEAVRNMPRDRNNYRKDFYAGRFAVLDNDRSLYPDTGYSGWVQLPSGDLYVINYTVDDAPRAYIRGYVVSRKDWFLFPEGDIPWQHASREPYVEIAAEWAEKQAAANRTKDRTRRVPTQK